MVRQSERNTGPRIVVVIGWELEAEAQLVAHVAKGHQVAPCNLVNPGEGTWILSLSYGEVYIPSNSAH